VPCPLRWWKGFRAHSPPHRNSRPHPAVSFQNSSSIQCCFPAMIGNRKIHDRLAESNRDAVSSNHSAHEPQIATLDNHAVPRAELHRRNPHEKVRGSLILGSAAVSETSPSTRTGRRNPGFSTGCGRSKEDAKDARSLNELPQAHPDKLPASQPDDSATRQITQDLCP